MWWFQNLFIFIPIWENDPIWRYKIFQMGWNHQPDKKKWGGGNTSIEKEDHHFFVWCLTHLTLQVYDLDAILASLLRHALKLVDNLVKHIFHRFSRYISHVNDVFFVNEPKKCLLPKVDEINIPHVNISRPSENIARFFQ